MFDLLLAFIIYGLIMYLHLSTYLYILLPAISAAEIRYLSICLAIERFHVYN